MIRPIKWSCLRHDCKSVIGEDVCTGDFTNHRLYFKQKVRLPYVRKRIDIHGTYALLCEHPDHGLCGFEAKTASAYRTEEWEDSIPDEYQLQVQHYMAVTGYRGFYIAVLIGGNSFRWKYIERDEELISMLIKLESDFWHRVENRIPPSADGSDASAKFLAERFPTGVPKSQIVLQFMETVNTTEWMPVLTEAG